MTPLEELGSLAKMPLEITAVLDSRAVTLGEMLAFEPGTIIRMNRSAGESIQIYAGGVHVADGDILAMENAMCVRVTDLRTAG